MKKRIAILLAFILMCSLLSACGKKTNKMYGEYKLTKEVVDGWVSSSEDSYLRGSSVSISKAKESDENTWASFYFYTNGEFSEIVSGYFTTVYETEDEIKYKLWMPAGYYGNLFKGVDDYLYFYYNPKEDCVEFRAGNDMSFYFYK